MVGIADKQVCWDCAIKYLGIQDLPHDQQLKILANFDKNIRP